MVGALTCAVLTACQPDSGGTFSYELELPNGRVKMACAPMINYQGRSVRISGLEIPLGTAAGVPLKLGNANLDETTLRAASDLIQTLDNAQNQYCRTLPFVNRDLVYKMWQDYNTQIVALSNLLRNLASAQNSITARAALATAGNLAATAIAGPTAAGNLAATATAAPTDAAPTVSATAASVAAVLKAAGALQEAVRAMEIANANGKEN